MESHYGCKGLLNNLLGAARVSPGPCSIPKAGIAGRPVRRRKDLRLLLRRYFVLAETDFGA